MLYNHSTEELIGLQDLIIEKIESDENEIHIYGKIKRKIHICPCCGTETNKIHDYRKQVIKDIPIYGKKHLFICQSAGIVVNAENASIKKYFFTPLPQENQPIVSVYY